VFDVDLDRAFGDAHVARDELGALAVH
jgi:hypothetical protein